ncbi:MAG: 3-dehydroquinate synthase II [Candidatus Nitrosoabyssus spongiisocia]|nr:MAG: 3-dehydroquinate synthase II [Nitrosopumilaceae archaeon AB1(1)]
MNKGRELIIEPRGSRESIIKLLALLKKEGIGMVHTNPKNVSGSQLKTMHTSRNSDYVIIKEGETIPRKKKIGRYFLVTSNKDIDKIFRAASKGLDFVLIEVKDWKIIPLENIIAKLHNIHTKIFARAHTVAEVRKMFSILDIGVDGVIFATSSINHVQEAMLYLGTKNMRLVKSKITDIKEVGDGERVCVDTASILKKGEGMLVGNKSNFLFLVHNESVGSSFTSPRPFRVNAGAVHCYTLSPDGTTKYLSEIESGEEVIILGTSGNARRVTVGRSKIERRPMLMIKSVTEDGEHGGIIVQDAETIRFVKPNGKLVSVTHLRKGDSVLVYSKQSTGRHFGMEVSDEYILEK